VAEDLSWTVILDRRQGPRQNCPTFGSMRIQWRSPAHVWERHQPDSGAPLIVNDERVLATEFEKDTPSEILGSDGGDREKDRRPIYL